MGIAVDGEQTPLPLRKCPSHKVPGWWGLRLRGGGVFRLGKMTGGWSGGRQALSLASMSFHVVGKGGQISKVVCVGGGDEQACSVRNNELKESFGE